MRRAEFMKRLATAREAVMREISNNRKGGEKYAAGISMEGYAGGYLQALDDVDAVLEHGHPGDPRHYWSKP